MLSSVFGDFGNGNARMSALVLRLGINQEVAVQTMFSSAYTFMTCLITHSVCNEVASSLENVSGLIRPGQVACLQ